MGYIYELMDLAKEKIAFDYGDMERKYNPIFEKNRCKIDSTTSSTIKCNKLLF